MILRKVLIICIKRDLLCGHFYLRVFIPVIYSHANEIFSQITNNYQQFFFFFQSKMTQNGPKKSIKNIF